jgi:hypothetical protein
VNEFISWIKEYVTEERYKAYMTREKEIILIPRRSTRPLEYAYMKFDKDEKLKKVIEALTAKNIRVWTLKAEEWDDQKPVGVRFPAEEL